MARDSIEQSVGYVASFNPNLLGKPRANHIAPTCSEKAKNCNRGNNVEAISSSSMTTTTTLQRRRDGFLCFVRIGCCRRRPKTKWPPLPFCPHASTFTLLDAYDDDDDDSQESITDHPQKISINQGSSKPSHN